MRFPRPIYYSLRNSYTNSLKKVTKSILDIRQYHEIFSVFRKELELFAQLCYNIDKYQSQKAKGGALFL